MTEQLNRRGQWARANARTQQRIARGGSDGSQKRRGGGGKVSWAWRPCTDTFRSQNHKHTWAQPAAHRVAWRVCHARRGVGRNRPEACTTDRGGRAPRPRPRRSTTLAPASSDTQEPQERATAASLLKELAASRRREAVLAAALVERDEELALAAVRVGTLQFGGRGEEAEMASALTIRERVVATAWVRTSRSQSELGVAHRRPSLQSLQQAYLDPSVNLLITQLRRRLQERDRTIERLRAELEQARGTPTAESAG